MTQAELSDRAGLIKEAEAGESRGEFKEGIAGGAKEEV